MILAKRLVGTGPHSAVEVKMTGAHSAACSGSIQASFCALPRDSQMHDSFGRNFSQQSFRMGRSSRIIFLAHQIGLSPKNLKNCQGEGGATHMLALTAMMFDHRDSRKGKESLKKSSPPHALSSSGLSSLALLSQLTPWALAPNTDDDSGDQNTVAWGGGQFFQTFLALLGVPVFRPSLSARLIILYRSRVNVFSCFTLLASMYSW